MPAATRIGNLRLLKDKAEFLSSLRRMVCSFRSPLSPIDDESELALAVSRSNYSRAALAALAHTLAL